jgi:uncharacterized protein YegL
MEKENYFIKQGNQSEKEKQEEKERDLMIEVKEVVRKEEKHLAVFAKDSSLRYEVSRDASTFAFYPEENKVEIPIGWFMEKDCSPERIRWALYHELSHFIDMRKNPKAYMENFEYMRSGSANKQICSWLEEKIVKDGVSKEKIEDLRKEETDEKGRTTNKLQSMAYGYLHTMFNVLDDIYVNNLVEQRAPVYSDEYGKKEVESIYKKLGFNKDDFTESPKHLQFIYSLIREEMLPNAEDPKIKEDVLEVLKNKKIYGKKIKEVIEEYLKPSSGELVDPEERYKKIKLFIEPLYLELLRKDIEEVDFKELEKRAEEQQSKKNKEGESGEEESETGEGESKKGSTSDFDPFKEDHKKFKKEEKEISDEDLEDMLKKIKEDKESEESNPQERKKRNQEKIKKQFDEKYEISEKTRDVFEKSSARTIEARKEMRKFWNNLIGESIGIVRKKKRGQRRGNVNIDDFIDSYPEITEGERTGKLNKLEIYERMISEMEKTSKPERIEVSLVCDMSGSMDSEKIRCLQETTALLLLSLKDFNSYLDQNRRELKTKLSAFSEVYVFGSNFEKAKEFEETMMSREKNNADIIRTFKCLQNTMGSTNDAKVLSEIVNSVDDDKVKAIKKGKTRKIVFEITDGQPDNDVVKETKKRINDMIDKNIIPVAFQIGKVSTEEKLTFQEIWNEGRENALGIQIGEEIEKLPRELIKILKQKFGNIKL